MSVHDVESDETVTDAAVPGVYEILGQVARTAPAGVSAEEIAAKWMVDAEVPEPWRSLFLPLVRDAIRHSRRNSERAGERRSRVSDLRRGVVPRLPLAQGDLSDASSAPAFTVDGLEGLAQQEAGWVRDAAGRILKWGDITVGQHVERIAWFRKQIGAMSDAAARHQVVVEQCNAAGVNTLFELIARLRKGSAA